MKTLKKSRHCVAVSLSICLVIGFSGHQSGHGQEPTTAAQPVVSLTIRNFRSLEKLASDVSRPFGDNEGRQLLSGLLNPTTLTNTDHIDPDKPWNIALWFERFGASPTISFRIPVTDLRKFTDSLPETSLLRPANEDSSIREVDGYGVFLSAFTPMTEAMKAAEADWHPAQLTEDFLADDPTILNLALHLEKSHRDSLKTLLGFSRKMMVNSLKSLSEPENGDQINSAAGAIPQPARLAELMILYFDAADAIINDLSGLRLGLGTSEDRLIANFRCNPLEDSLLAECFAAPQGSPESLLKNLPPGKHGYFAANTRFPESLLPGIRKLMEISMAIQGTPTTDIELDGMMDMIKLFLDYRMAGSVHFGDNLEFAAAYQFPGKTDQIFKTLLDYYSSPAIRSIAGQGKMFEDIKTTSKKLSADGKDWTIHRYEFPINREFPPFQAPGTRDMLSFIYGQDGMTYEFTASEDTVFYSMGTPLASHLSTNRKPIALPLKQNSIFVFHGDGLGMMKSLFPDSGDFGVDAADLDIHAEGNGYFQSSVKMSLSWLRIFKHLTSPHSEP